MLGTCQAPGGQQLLDTNTFFKQEGMLAYFQPAL